MKLNHWFYAVVVLCCMPLKCWALSGFTVHLPPENAYLESERVGIVLNVENVVLSSIRVVGGKNDTTEIQVSAAVPTLCFAVSLNHGLNVIELLGINQGKVVAQRSVKIFSKSVLDSSSRFQPTGFEPYVFHVEAREQACVACHDMNPTLSDLRPSDPVKSPCFSCHQRKRVIAFNHNPAAQWNCFVCHEVLDEKRKYTVPDPEQQMCDPCHHKEMKSWNASQVVHGPTAVGHCTICHDPHGSDRPGILRMQTTDLCINCHDDKASGAHVIAGFYGQGHPVRGVKDPFKPEREFTCAGCHDPHAGDTLNLLRHDNANMMEYCTRCHEI